VSVRIAEAAGETPWLELHGGMLTRTVAGAAFSAQSSKLSGFELGKVGAGFTKTGGDISIGFGDQSAQAAPLRLDASVDAQGAGRLRFALTPTKIGLIGKGLGILLPLPEVLVGAESELELPPGALGGGTITGKLKSTLKGFVPPHPPELDGFVFGDVTTFDTELSVDPARTRVTLTNSHVKAGRFELSGGGNVVRQGLDALVDLDFKGVLPCDALAGAAAESRLGKLLGRASASQGKRTALAIVRGDVGVEVAVKTNLRGLENAKLVQKIGIGCGLRPLSVPELIALTPNAKDLQAIGNEVGQKLESIGKDLGLPPVPSAIPLPGLPPFPGEPPAAPPKSPSKKKLAGAAPSG
jgi:hypothetical protein